jgi:Ser/Thr protein kinase RdoA (MazF antagonist)
VDALSAALAVAARLGLDASGALVLRELRTAVVHLRPSPVVARVAPASEEDAVRREVAVTAYLAARGAAVAAPYADPGPHLVDDLVVTLWKYVDHDDSRPLDGRIAGARLREIHDLLGDYEDEGLPHFARLDEVRAVVGSLELSATDVEDLSEMVALAEQRVAARDVRIQVVHGDSWLGNVLRTPEGPVWSDFEAVCRGPRELDLACNETAARRGRTPADDDLLAGYGAHDAALLEWVTPLELVPLTAWTYRLASTRPEFLEAARTRLTWALEGLRG